MQPFSCYWDYSCRMPSWLLHSQCNLSHAIEITHVERRVDCCIDSLTGKLHKLILTEPWSKSLWRLASVTDSCWRIRWVKTTVSPQSIKAKVCFQHREMARVGQNHIYTVYIRHVWQGNHEIYGQIRCIYTVLANPIIGTQGCRSTTAPPILHYATSCNALCFSSGTVTPRDNAQSP